MTILCIDLGTQSIRVALVSEQGQIIAIHSTSQDISSPFEGWAEQSAHFWWHSVQEGIETLLCKYPDVRTTIRGIISCGQMHGPVGVKKTGEIVTPQVQIWCDKRPKDLCQLLENTVKENAVWEKTGNVLSTGWMGIKVRWIKENQPNIYQQTDLFLTPKDFINFQLTGECMTDYSEASGTYLFDWRKNSYSEDLAAILLLDLTKFAPIISAFKPVGILKSNLCAEWHLPVSLPVFAGGGDFIVSLLGLGLIAPGIAIDMTGTSTLFVIQHSQPIISPGIQNLHHVLDGWIPFIMLDTGGLNMKWAKDLFNMKESSPISYEEMIHMAEAVPIGSEGVLFYPYLLGERRSETINASGCLTGLRPCHNLAHIARAVMEGTAMALAKDVHLLQTQISPLQCVYCVGGATRNRLLYQIKANILNLPMYIFAEPESSIIGCAALASYGLGDFSNFHTLPSSLNSDSEIILPDENVVRIYQPFLSHFIRFYDYMLGYWK